MPEDRPRRDAQEAARCPLSMTRQTATSNSLMAANTFEVRATDPSESGKEVTTMAGKNAGSAVNLFEQRAAQEAGTH